MRLRSPTALALAALLALAGPGCSDDGGGDPADAGPDGIPSDAVGDAGGDAGPGDAGPDGGPDADDGEGPGTGDADATSSDDGGGDAEPDAGSDATGDAGPDGDALADGDAADTAGDDVVDAAPDGAEPDAALDGDAADATGPCTGPDDCPPAPEPCMEHVCQEGSCVAVPLDEGASCDDGDPCTVDETCQDGSCVGPFDRSVEGCDSGNACAEAPAVEDLPFEQTGDTSDAAGDASAAGCGFSPTTDGSASNDDLYRFEPPETGDYRIELADATGMEGALDALLYVRDACPLGSSACLAADDAPQPGGESLLLHLEAGTTYWIVVDGFSGTDAVSGSYELRVERAVEEACDDGTDNDGDGAADCADDDCAATEACSEVDACAEAVAVETLPFTHEGSNEGAGNAYNAAPCPGSSEDADGSGSNDVAFTYTAEEAGTVLVRLAELPDADDPLDAVLSAHVGCPAEAGSSCVASEDVVGSPGGESLAVPLAAGETLFVVVDGFDDDGNVTGTFELHMEAAAEVESDCDDGLDEDADGDTDCADEDCADAPACGGGSACDDAIPIEEVPFSYEGSTEEAGNQITVGGETATCPDADADEPIGSLGGATNDVVFSYTPGETATHELALTEGEELEDLVLALYRGTCPDKSGTQCVLADDEATFSTGGGEQLTVELEGGVTYYVVVDGWANSAPSASNGPFELTVSQGGPDTETDCADGVDGDGDGDTDCADEDCADAFVCQPGGPACEDPEVVDELPYTVEGTTAEASDDVTISPAEGTEATTCRSTPDDVPLGELGAASGDRVFEFTPADDGGYAVELTEGESFAEHALAVYEGDCPDAGTTTCLGADHVAGQAGGERVALQLDAGTTYRIVVDGAGNDEATNGPFELRVEPLPDSETSCDDDVDDDGDGLPDCQDPDCASVEACMPGDGGSCESPLPIGELPFASADGASTSGMVDTYAIPGGACPRPDSDGTLGPVGTGSPEVFYELEPAESGTHRIRLAEADGVADHALAVFEGTCPQGTAETPTCLAGDDVAGGAGEDLLVSLEAETSYYVVVEAVEGGGPYDLRVDPVPDEETDCSDGVDEDLDGATDCADDDCADVAACDEGQNCGDLVDNDADGAVDCADDDCSDAEGCASLEGSGECGDPFVVDELPFTSPSGLSTEGAGNNVFIPSDAGCSSADDDGVPVNGYGSEAPDVVYAFTPPESGSYAFELAGGEPYADLGMSLFEGGCPTGSNGGSCLVGDDDVGPGGESFTAELEAGTSYVVVLDGITTFAGPTQGLYELHVAKAEAGGVVPGDLAVTELMGNPDGELSDAEAEYVELVNAAEAERSLQGLQLAKWSWDEGAEPPAEPDATAVVDAEITLGPGETALLARSESSAGVDAAMVDATVDVALNNSGMVRLQLVDASWDGEAAPADAQIVDEVVVPAGAFGDEPGRSWQLDESLVGPDAASANDDPASWCYTPTSSDDAYASGNYGTPGGANVTCP